MTGTHRINKKKAIELIIQELEKGMTKSECLAINGENWQFPSRTFDRYWKEANEAYSERQKSIQSELMSVRIDHEKERLKKALLTLDEKREISAKIARGESYESGGEIVVPSPSDRLKAMEYDSKLVGDIAPTKFEQKISYDNMTDEDLLSKVKEIQEELGF